VEESLKNAVCDAIDARRQTIQLVGSEIFAAELGFKEQRAARW